jgi:hypothetical protein
MAKVTIDLGYKSYVLDVKDALALAEIVSKAEMFEEKYHGSGQDNTYHVFPNEDRIGMRILPESLYNMAKLAGKPAKS